MASDVMVKQFHIDIEGQTLILRKLSTSGEMAFQRMLAARLKKSWGAAGYAANCREMWDFFKANGMGPELEVSVRSVTQMQANNAPPEWEAMQAYRQTPDGVALEVWFRRDPDAHSSLTEPGVRAMVTDVNAWEVAQQISAGLSDDGKS